MAKAKKAGIPSKAGTDRPNRSTGSLGSGMEANEYGDSRKPDHASRGQRADSTPERTKGKTAGNKGVKGSMAAPNS